MATGNPSAFLDFDIVGNKRGVEAMLSNLDSCLSPVGLSKFLLGGVGPMVKQRAANRFGAEGDDVSGKWAPLQDSTQAIRESQGFGGSHPINRRTGELEEYITQSDFGVTLAPGVTSLQYPKEVPASKALTQKVKTAQSGRKSPRTVARPVLGLNERDLGQVVTMLAFFIQSGGVVR